MTLDKNKIEALATSLINDAKLCEHGKKSPSAAKPNHAHLASELLAMDGSPYIYLYQSSTWYSPIDQSVSSWLTIVNPGPTFFESFTDTLLLSTFFGPLPTTLIEPSLAPTYRDIRLPLSGYGGITLNPYSYASFDISIPIPCDYPVSTKALSHPSTMCGDPYGTVEPICGDTLILNLMLWNIHQEGDEWLQPITQITTVYDLKTTPAMVIRQPE